MRRFWCGPSHPFLLHKAGVAMAAAAAGYKASAGPVPTWQQLSERVLATQTGAKLRAEDAERARGLGPAHRASTLRLFDALSSDKIRVKLYRDSAAWCPYCQKLWIMLEEKRIPYTVELINMRSYGDKPKSFLAKCPRGLLPAVELDGKLSTESLEIMASLDATFTGTAHRPMLPPRGSPAFAKAQELLQMERALFSAWCSYVFRPGTSGRAQFERVLGSVESALAENPNVPWFLDFTDGPSLVDLQYVSHVERMLASVPYWKGHDFRNDYPHIDRWLSAFEQRQSYMATKSDWYTHVKDIPPQYGPGVSVPAASSIKAAIDGGDASWQLPLPPLAESQAPSDVLQRQGWETYEASASHEAAYRIALNHKAVVGFMARGAGQPGGWADGRPDRAELADPYAKSADGDAANDADLALRIVVVLLLDGAVPTEAHAALLGCLHAAGPARQRDVISCAHYLCQRVGVPRDMTYPAARCLRGSLNWVSSSLQRSY